MLLMRSVRQLWMPDKAVILNLFGFCLIVLLLPLRWLFAVITAACIHELGHYLAVYLCGGNIRSLRFAGSGAMMYATGLTTRAEVICLLAGPLMGLMPLLFTRQIPIIAVCGLVQTIYNLLPIDPLDGGKILHHMILICGGTERYYRSIERTFIFALTLTCICISLRFGIPLLIIPVACILRKIPCKQRPDWI